MGLMIARDRVAVDWYISLPFNNVFGIHFDFETGLPGYDPTPAFSVEKNTHLWLAFCAATLIEGQSRAGKHLHDLIQPWQGELGDGFHDGLLRGLWDADKRAPYNDPAFDLIPTWKSHFYDPDSRATWTGETATTALSRGCVYYRLSGAFYRKQQLAEAGYALGLATHYLSDLTQPMHAANFTWFDSQSVGYHTDFERYVKSILHRIERPSVYRPVVRARKLEGFFHAVARHSKHTYYAAICKPEWTRTFGEAERADAVWKKRVGGVLPFILHDAVQMVAQFLLLWAEETLTSSK